MTLALYTDTVAWLDQEKVSFEDENDAEPESTSADRVIRSALAHTFPDHVSLWDVEPTGGQEATPGIIRTIAAMLMSAYRYSKKYSEETVKKPNYASNLEDRAMVMLAAIVSGEMGLDDVAYDDPGGDSSTQFSSDDFYPNDQTALDDPESDHKFTMNRVS